MRLTHPSLAIVLILVLAPVGSAQAPETRQERDTPAFRVQVWGDIATEFSMRVRSYADLRSELERNLPALRVTDDPAEIRGRVRALARRIRVARAEARQGDIFTPAISIEFRKALLPEVNASTWDSINYGGPRGLSTRINGIYPERKPVSTMPPNILAVLPKLPDDIEYRFVGRHLILIDTRARVIIDRLPNAIQCN
jgi:hypothetical protein